jgi:hypothetical protein
MSDAGASQRQRLFNIAHDDDLRCATRERDCRRGEGAKDIDDDETPTARSAPANKLSMRISIHRVSFCASSEARRRLF